MVETSAAAAQAEKKQKTDQTVAVTKCLLLQYEYVDGILEKRAPHRAGHLAHWQRLADADQVLLGGAFDPPSGAMIVLRGIDRDEVEALVKDDPYFTNGLVPSYVIRDWNVVLGSALRCSSLAVQGPTLQAMTDLKIGHPAPKLSRARTMELYERNSWLTRSTSDTSVTMRLDGPHPLRMARMASTHFQQGRATEETPDQRWFKTTATSFAKYGIYPGQGLKGMYMRDPHTGVWFKVRCSKGSLPTQLPELGGCSDRFSNAALAAPGTEDEDQRLQSYKRKFEVNTSGITEVFSRCKHAMPISVAGSVFNVGGGLMKSNLQCLSLCFAEVEGYTDASEILLEMERAQTFGSEYLKQKQSEAFVATKAASLLQVNKGPSASHGQAGEARHNRFNPFKPDPALMRSTSPELIEDEDD
ncbi:unnamed protein product [Symbiodinium sp. CCMP2592]|nr:unnamed protein product [Symbiodinium sp. CCMP2592]